MVLYPRRWNSLSLFGFQIVQYATTVHRLSVICFKRICDFLLPHSYYIFFAQYDDLTVLAGSCNLQHPSGEQGDIGVDRAPVSTANEA
jgi:hypothetical protein